MIRKTDPGPSEQGHRDRSRRRREVGRDPGWGDAGGRGRLQEERQRLAYESARIMAEQGIVEFDRARRKAAQRIGVTDKRCWPDNEEIEQALLQHYRLFHGEAHLQVVAELRARALAAMTTFAEFDPRLVGQAVSGTATREQGVQVQLFADDPGEILFRLVDRGIPWQERDAQFRYPGGASQSHPVLAFVAGDVPIELIVLPTQAKRNPPLCPVSERPQRGLSTAELRRLLAEPAPADPRDG